MITDRDTGTRVDEIAAGIYRISVPVTAIPGGFTFNHYLIADDEPLLFHAGKRSMFDLIKRAVSAVMPAERLRHIAFSHYEADESGALNEFLATAPHSAPLCGVLAARVSINDAASRPARPLEDGEVVSLGRHSVRWIATPHFPHGWESGLLLEETTGTLFCSDLFTHGGADHPVITEADILGPSEALRARLDFYAHARNEPAMVEKVAATAPTTLALMHGPAWRGDGAALIRALGERLAA
jgi:flavorubredoxin